MRPPPTPHVALTADRPAIHLALMVTRRCNMACGHCSVESGPHVKGEPEERELLDWVRQAAGAGVRSIRLTGGEPMLRSRVVVRLVRECRRLGVVSSMTTNGFWGKSLTGARRHLRALRRAGLGPLTVSYDRYHADFQGHEPLLNILRAAEEAGVAVNVNVVRGADDRELADIVSRFESAPNARLRFYDLQPVGRARQMPADSLRSEVEGFCSACASPAITDDGRLIACNGPAYFSGPRSPLNVGSLREAPLQALLQRHREDPVLDTIRTLGPAGLRDELRRIPGFEAFPFRRHYLGICDLCHHITGSPEAVRALRERLAVPPLAAGRRAVWQVIDASRRVGALNPRHVNGVGVCRMFLRAAWEPGSRWTLESAKLLGRADLDWRHLANYLAGCGLARPLLGALEDPELTRWAPRFFLDDLRTRAVRDGLLELIQREAIRGIGSALRELGGPGVLLKGTALMLRGPVDGNGPVARSTGDIDVYVAPRLAPELRRRLLAQGFDGVPDAERTAPHHLAAVSFQGVLVEIHTRIMAPLWGLPEHAMLARVRPLEGSDPLATLDAEGLLLHAGVHTSQHFFTHGLKTAWDVLWILRTHAEIDWDRLAGWVGACRVPRGFWVPARVLAEELGIPIPAEFLRQAPLDARQRKLELIASHRLFYAIERQVELNAITKTGLVWLLHDSWIDRLRYLAGEARWRGLRRSAWEGPLSRAGRGASFRQAWVHWGQYRRALARTVVSPGD